MRNTSIAMTLAAAILALCAGCAKQEQPHEEAQLPQVLCDPATMRGTVALDIKGNPGDSFRISYRCGNDVVAQCTATIAVGANTATCNSGPNPVPKGGVRTCPVGPGNNNSPAAAVQNSGCA
jgi:hypothetical protein